MSQRSPSAATVLLGVVLAATALLAALATSPAGARVLASSVSGFTGGPALAGDGHVVVGERRGNGALRILAIGPSTGAQTEVTAFGALADPEIFPLLGISGTGGIVTASHRTQRREGVPNALSNRIVTILPAVAELGSCPEQRDIGPTIQAAGGDRFVATIKTDCGAAPSAVRIRSDTGTRTIPLAFEPRDRSIAPLMYMLHATGPMVAWVEAHYPGGLLAESVVVARAATGEVLLRLALPIGLLATWGLASDGTVVFGAGDCSLRLAAPAAPVPRIVRLPDGLCPDAVPPLLEPDTIAIAGERIVYPSSDGRYAVTDLQGAAQALPEAGTRRFRRSPVAFDGRTAFVLRSDCDADRLLALDTGPAAAAATAPGPADPCPVRRAGPSALRVSSDGRVSIAVRCAAGCRGTLRLIEQRRGLRERRVGEVAYAGIGSLVLRPRIARYARALAGCGGGLRVRAVLHVTGREPTAGYGQGFGIYRIASRSRCRRGGGPAFMPRRRGPRP